MEIIHDSLCQYNCFSCPDEPYLPVLLDEEARHFSYALNPFGHSANGLEAAICIVKKAERFKLHMTGLKETHLPAKKFLD